MPAIRAGPASALALLMKTRVWIVDAAALNDLDARGGAAESARFILNGNRYSQRPAAMRWYQIIGFCFAVVVQIPVLERAGFLRHAIRKYLPLSPVAAALI